jgi:NADH-quinone oxidoreductase subunit C
MTTLAPTDLQTVIAEIIQRIAPEAIIEQIIFRDEVTFVLDKTHIVAIIAALRADPRTSFTHLTDVNAVDYLEASREPRFDVVYHLYSLEHFHRVRLRCPVSEAEAECRIDSLTGLWAGANYMERETYDMFGIIFDGHPDLTRILMPDNWEGHPLRKDFPLGGAKSFYYKQDTNEYAGEPADLVPRIRVQDTEI